MMRSQPLWKGTPGGVAPSQARCSQDAVSCGSQHMGRFKLRPKTSLKRRLFLVEMWTGDSDTPGWRLGDRDDSVCGEAGNRPGDGTCRRTAQRCVRWFPLSRPTVRAVC